MYPIPIWHLPLAHPPRVKSIGLGTQEDLLPRSYHHLDFWCLHFYRWHGEVGIDGHHTVPILPGHAGICPPSQSLDYTCQTAVQHVYVHFHLDESSAGPDVAPIPALIDLGDDFERMSGLMREAIGWQVSAPRRASARLWDVLWHISTLPRKVQSSGHPAVAAARNLIELRLADQISIQDLAISVQCSHNHLIRLFRSELGTTIVGYIRGRRMERARMMLEHGSMPIRSVAAEVGIGDLSYFNRLIRSTFGMGPRALRRGFRRTV